MAINVRRITAKYYKQWVNDPTFSTSLSEFTNNLAGLVMQKFRVVQQVGVSWLSQSSLGVPFAFETTSLEIRWTNGKFLTDGFWIGDTIIFHRRDSSGLILSTHTATIAYVDNDLMTFTAAASPLFPSATTTNSNSIIYGTTPLTSLFYKYGTPENGDTFTNISSVTNENQEFYSLDEIGANMPRDINVPVQMEALGIPNSWKNGSASVQYQGFGSEVEEQLFEITHEFIVPYYNAGTDVNTPLDDLLGSNSFKYVFGGDFRTVISDPNTSKPFEVDNIKGSVGDFNEAFNGLDSNYQVSTVTYTDTALNSSDGVLLNGTTKVTIVVNKILGSFTNNDNIGVYFSYLPRFQAEVENTSTDFEVNFMYDNIFATANDGLVAGSGLLNNLQVVDSGSTITIDFETSLTTIQKLRLTDESQFIFGLEVGDSSISAANSDAVMLRVDGVFDISADIDGLITLDTRFYPHTEDFSTSLGFTQVNGWNEHGLGIKGTFTLDHSKNAFLNSFDVLLVAYNSSKNSYFELDSYSYQLGSLISNGIQVFNSVDSRNYPLIAGSEKNGITLTGETLGVYDFTNAIKFSWEDWVANPDVDSSFVDVSKPNNNQNLKTSNYSLINGYAIKMIFAFNLTGVNTLGQSGDTDYLFLTPDFTIYDYDKDGNIVPDFTQVIELFDNATMTPLNGQPLTGSDTLFRITWTFKTPLTDISSFWGIHRIEISEQTGKQLHELSSVDPPPTNNIFNDGQQLSLSLVSGNLVTEGVIDGNQITAGIDYNFSGEIGNPAQSGTPPEGGTNKVLEDGTPKILEDGTNKILE